MYTIQTAGAKVDGTHAMCFEPYAQMKCFIMRLAINHQVSSRNCAPVVGQYNLEDLDDIRGVVVSVITTLSAAVGNNFGGL